MLETRVQRVGEKSEGSEVTPQMMATLNQKRRDKGDEQWWKSGCRLKVELVGLDD